MSNERDSLKNAMAVVGGKSMLSIASSVNLMIERDVFISSISALLGIPFEQVDKATKSKTSSELEEIKYKIATGEIRNIETI